MATKKKAIAIGGINSTDEAKEARLNNVPESLRLDYAGVAGDPISEPIPAYIQTPSEKVISGMNNSWIVFGRDRPQSRLSGYGGKGDTQCGSLDLVVGRLGAEARSFSVTKGSDDSKQRIWVDPDVNKDAARIYMSQKTDIDENFNLADGSIGNSKTKSGIALKADGIRIIGREGIKLVTRTDRRNSQGADIESVNGIDLLASNNDEDLQPLVKGENLREALERLTTHLDKLNGIVDSLLMYQIGFNEALTHHTHLSPGKVIPLPPPLIGAIWETFPSMPVVASGVKTMIDHLSQTKKSLATHKANLALFQFSYLNPAGSKYINSRFNNTT